MKPKKSEELSEKLTAYIYIKMKFDVDRRFQFDNGNNIYRDLPIFQRKSVSRLFNIRNVFSEFSFLHDY